MKGSHGRRNIDPQSGGGGFVVRASGNGRSNLSKPSHGTDPDRREPRCQSASLHRRCVSKCIISVIALKGGLQEILNAGSKGLMVLNQAFRGNILSSSRLPSTGNSIRLGSDHKLTEPLVIGKILIR